MNPVYISIDWGGTKARAAVVNESGLAHRFNTKSANIRLMTHEQFRDIGREIFAASAAIDPAVCLIGAAGAGDKDSATLLESTLLAIMPAGSEVRVYPDYLCNHAAAFAGNDGILCVNGTGSVIFSRCNQSMSKTGGLGYLLDRAPSGAYLGRKALQLMLDADAATRDEFCQIAKSLGLPHSSETVLTQLYNNAQPQRYAGQFAPVLTRAYDSQNQTAQAIVTESFDHMIEQLLRCMPPGINLPVCLYGGLWEGWAEMTSAFKQRLQSAGISLNIAEAKFSSDLGPLLYYKNSHDFAAQLAAQVKSQEQAK